MTISNQDIIELKGFNIAFGSGNVEFDLTVSVDRVVGLRQDAFHKLESIADDIALGGTQNVAPSIPVLARNIVLDAVRRLTLGAYFISIRLTECNGNTFSETVCVEQNEFQGVISASRSKLVSIEIQVMFPRKLQVEFTVTEASQWLSRTELDTDTILGRLDSSSQSSFPSIHVIASELAAETLKMLSAAGLASPTVEIRIKELLSIYVATPYITVKRTFADFPALFGKKHVAIAFGSNLGDSYSNIESALRLLESPTSTLPSLQPRSYVDIVDTSFLYETEPMYVTDQAPFVNGACMLETNIRPLDLLALLKEIEKEVGRVPSVRFGPRAIDLDIAFYDTEVIDTRVNKSNLQDLDGHLVVPHPRMCEREFVLRPLADMIPGFRHPLVQKTIGDLLQAIEPQSMLKLVPFLRTDSSPKPSFDTLTAWTYPSSSSRKGHKTHLMATLNVTPDSFSDGSTHQAVGNALEYVYNSVKGGASIIDIGGYSTRPGAKFVSVEEEIERVVPVVRAIREWSSRRDSEAGGWDQAVVEKAKNIPISVDTFRWEVAESALEAGASCINDVYSFTGPHADPSIPSLGPGEERHPPEEYLRHLKSIARRFAVPVVLMHSRGDAGKDKTYNIYDYAKTGDATDSDSAPGTTIEGVRIELGRKVDEIVKGKGGVRRWLVIVDPGVGFSKTLQGNLEVIARAQDIVSDVWIGKDRTILNPLRGYPLLIGASRKSFLGVILENGEASRKTAPKERGWATAATVCTAVQQGALVVRVHDTREMMDVIKVSEALWVA